MTKQRRKKMSKPETITIDEVKYVRADAIKQPAQKVDGMKYCVIRSYGAGVFCGYVKEQKSDVNGVNVVLINSRRIFYWTEACSLSQLAIEGSKDINNCKIAIVVPEQFIANVIEIIPMSQEAAKQIQGAVEWKK
jgi:hypothetical protein